MEIHQEKFLADLKERFERLGIKALLLDLDDTLIYTQEMFTKYMNLYVDTVSVETGLPNEVVREVLERLNNDEYKRMGVNPARWGVVIEKMALELSDHSESITKNLDILVKIYYEKPRLKSGVRAILEILRELGIKLALVTHANVEWTWRKLEDTGLAEYFDVIKIVDENKHKGIEDWVEAVTDLSVLPEECLALGDNLGGDVIPTHKMGARTMWLHTGSTWSVYKVGTPPEETVHLDEINKLFLALDQFA